MNEVLYTERALDDLERPGDILLASDPLAAATTAGIIFEASIFWCTALMKLDARCAPAIVSW